MNELTRSISDLWRGPVSVVLALLLALAAACAPAASPSDPEPTSTPSPEPAAEPTAESSGGYVEPEPDMTQTTDPTPSPEPAIDPEPPGDCWGGALDEDPLHCHVLERAQKDGRLKVVGVYEAPNDILHIFMEQDETLTDADAEYFSQQAREFLAGPEGAAYVQQVATAEDRRACLAKESNALEWRGCIVLGIPFNSKPSWYSGSDRRTIRLVPPPANHGQIYLRPGGVEARRAVSGWASWTQLWPVVSPGGTQGASGSGGFDVSVVDTVNFPEPDCDLFYSGDALACEIWMNDPETGVAGYEWGGEHSYPYVQVKVPPAIPTDPAKLEALKRRVLPGLWEEEYEGMVLIPVKYDFGQMWRWSEVLNRFALSAGNTIGIVGAGTGINNMSYGGETVFVSGLTDWGGGNWDDGDAVARIRTTVAVAVLDLEPVVEALPELLPLLGIPVDAVGVVYEVEEVWEPIYLE